MEIRKLIYICLALLVTSANATEIVHYTNKPVVVQLYRDQERMLQVGDHVQVGVSSAQQAQRLFRVQSAQGAVHIRPNKAFDRERVQVKRMTDGKVVLLDLVAIEPGVNSVPLEDMRIFLESENTIDRGDKASLSGTLRKTAITPITLTRYVAQKLYAPTRLHQEIAGISEEHLNDLIEKEIRIFKGINRTKTKSQPVLAYKSGNQHIVALLVRNSSSEPLILNYLDINLPFTHATFQHHKLNSAGQAGDRTILYLVNNRPSNETLVPWSFYSMAETDVKEGQ